MLKEYLHEILTQDGPKNINNILPGDKVYAISTNQFNPEYRPVEVLDITKQEPTNLVSVLFSDQRELIIPKGEKIYSGIKRDIHGGVVNKITLNLEDPEYMKGTILNANYEIFVPSKNRFECSKFVYDDIDPYSAGILFMHMKTPDEIFIPEDLQIADSVYDSIAILTDDKDLRYKYYKEIFLNEVFFEDINDICTKYEFSSAENACKFLAGVIDSSLVDTYKTENRIVLRVTSYNNKFEYSKAEALANLFRSLGEKVQISTEDRSIFLALSAPFKTIYSYHKIYKIIRDRNVAEDTLPLITPTCVFNLEGEYKVKNLVLPEPNMLYLLRNYLPRVSM